MTIRNKVCLAPNQTTEWMNERTNDERTNEIRTVNSRAKEIYVCQFLTLFPVVVRFVRFTTHFVLDAGYRRPCGCCCRLPLLLLLLLLFSFHRRKSTIVSRTNGLPQIELGNVFLVHRAPFFSLLIVLLVLCFASHRFVLANLCFHRVRQRARLPRMMNGKVIKADTGARTIQNTSSTTRLASTPAALTRWSTPKHARSFYIMYKLARTRSQAMFASKRESPFSFFSTVGFLFVFAFFSSSLLRFVISQ